MTVTIRTLHADDSLQDLTTLVNRAYKQLADLGFQYVATWQDAAITKKRVEGGECWVAEQEGRVVGTIMYYGPGSDHPAECAYYQRQQIAVFGQFAVEPALQKTGIGRQLMKHVENRASEEGALEICCDTAEGATHLVEWYRRMGYAVVDTVDWGPTNYLSVVLSKPLAVAE